MENSPKMKYAIKKAFAELDAMTPEEFDKLLGRISEPTCQPDTCAGQCQGMGWCDVCREFMGEPTTDDYDDAAEELLP